MTDLSEARARLQYDNALRRMNMIRDELKNLQIFRFSQKSGASPELFILFTEHAQPKIRRCTINRWNECARLLGELVSPWRAPAQPSGCSPCRRSASAAAFLRRYHFSTAPDFRQLLSRTQHAVLHSTSIYFSLRRPSVPTHTSSSISGTASPASPLPSQPSRHRWRSSLPSPQPKSSRKVHHLSSAHPNPDTPAVNTDHSPDNHQ